MGNCARDSEADFPVRPWDRILIMIVRSQPSFRDALFAVHGSILPHIAPRLCVIAGISVAAIWVEAQNPDRFVFFSAIPFTLIGIALSVFMSFRNNTCYARWWEGRQLWGELIVAARSFARTTSLLPEECRRELSYGVCGFACGLAARLRGEDEIAAIAPWVSTETMERDPNPTNAVLDRMGRSLLKLVSEDVITPIHYSVIEGEIGTFSSVQGACERIASTPVPFAYSLLLHRTALVFCVTLPFALAGALGWWTLLPVLLVAYTFFGLDALGTELEDPFGVQPNSLPIYALKRTIERDMLSLLGEENLPPPLQADRHILS